MRMQQLIAHAAASINANSSANDRAAMEEKECGIQYIGERNETRAAKHEAEIARLNAAAQKRGYILV